MNSNLDAGLDHSSILRSPCVDCSKCLFEYLARCRDQSSAYYERLKNSFGSQFLILESGTC